VDIHQNEVRAQSPGRHDRVLASLGFTHDLEAVGRVDDFARGGAKGFLIVTYQDLHSHALSAA
jgi:hypothetical protein